MYKGIRHLIKSKIRQELKRHHIVRINSSERKILEKIRAEEDEKNKKIALEKDRLLEEQEQRKEEQKVWEEFCSSFKGFDKDHVWAFNSGNSGNDFRGNPKYLFAYINYYRPDIRAYWLCPSEETVSQIRSLGFTALLSGSPEAAFAGERTGVAVTEQVKNAFPFADAKYLNLWHGTGHKKSERARVSDDDDIRLELAKKYIKNNSFCLNQMLIAVTSPYQEKQFQSDFRLPADQMLRIGYARCTYQKKYKPITTFDHDILSGNGLDQNVRIAVYAPTFRNHREAMMAKAVPDIRKLYECCEKNRILLIFKMHPLMENDIGFQHARKKYGHLPYFLFWDNQDDIYEILDQIDTLIYDYSSIVNDFILAGVKHYIRYFYDGEDADVDGHFENLDEYLKETVGPVCKDLDELIEAIGNLDKDIGSTDLTKALNRHWAYAGEDDFEKTIQEVMKFKIKKHSYPILYSYDVFDTLISRKGLHPFSIFYAVREKMREKGGYPEEFISRYPALRHFAESNVREYMYKTQDQRHSFRVEITMDKIFKRMCEVYPISEEQADELMKWEIEEEISSVIPLSEQIEKVRKLKEANETVVLISDMYLPGNVILQMLQKADPFLSTLPLYVSNDYGVLKSSGLLFFEVYRSFQPFYSFAKWIHTGDNLQADKYAPRKLNIYTRYVEKPEFSDIEKMLTDSLDDANGFLIAAMQARMKKEFGFAKADFVIDFVAPALVSYVDWVIRDALTKGFSKLYFIARDGYMLKLIADELIKTNGWPVKTKYIYASRRAWRIPSYFNEIDVDFWSQSGGNFKFISSRQKFLHALDIEDEDTFQKLLPQIDLDGIDFAGDSSDEQIDQVLPVIRSSEAYREYLLKRAEDKRGLVLDYLKQEIDFSEKYAFVEFWGIGYNQECHRRLMNHITGKDDPIYYYYARSVRFTDDENIRYNMTYNDAGLLFLEAIFANMPYKSVENYYKKDGKVYPILQKIVFDNDLFDAMSCLLPVYAHRYTGLQLKKPIGADRKLFDFILDYFTDHKYADLIYENIGGLIDSAPLFGEKKEFARPYTFDDLERFHKGISRGVGTHSVAMSYMRSTPEVQESYREMFQISEGSDPTKGQCLSYKNIERNRSEKESFRELSRRSEAAARQYQKACEKTRPENLVVIVTAFKKAGAAARTMMKQLDKQERLVVKLISGNCSQDKDAGLMEILSGAKVIITEGNVKQLVNLRLRQGTLCISLKNPPFKIYRYGHDFRHELIWKNKNEALANNIYSLKEYPGKGQVDLINKCTNANITTSAVIRGAAITDIYFDKEYVMDIKNKIRLMIPEIGNRKLIYYMPSLREREGTTGWLELLDLERLGELAADQYYLLLDIRTGSELLKGSRNCLTVPDFCSLIPDKAMSIREYLCAADIIAGDYRDTFFEAVFLEKPTYSTAVDMEMKQRELNIAFDFPQMNPFPLVYNADDFYEKIQEADNYDYRPLREFRNLYFTWCDGKSAKRITDYILSFIQPPESSDNC